LQKSLTAMVVGIGFITLRLRACRSLKEKRKALKSVIARVRNNFNASVAEVGHQDSHKNSTIGFSMVGNDKSLINSKADKVFNMVCELGFPEVVDTELEIIFI